jgi:6-pyruvoyl-tetrahydropterin synthase
MYAVEVRDHIMIAHSLPGEVFGPAQRLHGATFVVDVAFMRESLGADNIVVDIGLALQALRETLQPLNYVNLDDHPSFVGEKTTVEFMARHIFERMAEAIQAGRLGPEAAGIKRVRVTLKESHVARAWYEAALSA